MTPLDTHTDQRQLDPTDKVLQQVRLRVLATTDIHMQLLGFDYVNDCATAHGGLSSIATLIHQARAEAKADGAICILLDNGDLLQGNALGQHLAGSEVTAHHPVARICNHLRYDALGLGNHDLDHGLAYMQTIAQELHMPVLSTNLQGPALKQIQPHAILNCALPGSPSGKDAINIGVLSVLPLETETWNHSVLNGQARVVNPVDAVKDHVKKLRQRGVDVVVVLAHMGIDAQRNAESAVALAEIPGVDVIITGHTHRRFPGKDHSHQEHIDITNGTIARRPAAMPGHAASDLAVLDIELAKPEGGRWQLANHHSQLLQNETVVRPDPKVRALCQSTHDNTRRALATEIGQTDRDLNNFFSLAMPTSISALIARANAMCIRNQLEDQKDRDLPLLAAVAAHTAGGRAGPDNFLHIPKGPVLRRHLAGLNPYADTVCALRVTGDGLRHWLEKSAEIFADLTPGNPDQPLVDPAFPSFNFDTVFGVTYLVDPTRPKGMRILDLSYEGNPIKDDQKFLLSTNGFRAAGGGGLLAGPAATAPLRQSITTQSAILAMLQTDQVLTWPGPTPWRYSTRFAVSAVLETAPAALDHLKDIAQLSPEGLGLCPRQFARIRLTL